MNNVTEEYCDERELDRGAHLTATSYDPTQLALVTEARATVGGKPVTAEISGIATGKGEDGTVNVWLPPFCFKSKKGEVKQVPGLNAVTTLSPRQGAIDTAKALASYVNRSKTPYRAKISGDRRHAKIVIALAAKNWHTQLGSPRVHL